MTQAIPIPARSHSNSSPGPISPAALFLAAFSSPSNSDPDAEGTVISGYTLGPIIGRGAFSTIRLATSPSSSSTAAVKIVKRSRTSSLLKREAAVWASLSHEHILPLFSTVNTLQADYFFTLYCPAGSLFDILKRDGRPALPQDDAGMMFRQVVRGLRYLHEVARCVHRDIKLENVLVDEMGGCRIADFGMTRVWGDEESDEEDEEEDATPEPACMSNISLIRHNPPRHRNSSPFPLPTPFSSSGLASPAPRHVFRPGSLPYAAPELLLPAPIPTATVTATCLQPHAPIPTPTISPAQDIWALGVLLYALLTGCLPFVDSFEPRLQMKILHGTYPLPASLALEIGKTATRILRGCLDRSPSTRWTIAMVDEVGWGVGWGGEGDGASPVEEEVGMDRSSSESSSGSSALLTSPSPPPPPSLSLDRAYDRNRNREPSPLSSRSPPTSLSPDRYRSDSDEHERGRNRLWKPQNSRSPSPSVVPTTPIDFGCIGIGPGAGDQFPLPEMPGPDGRVMASSRSRSRSRSPRGRTNTKVVRTPLIPLERVYVTDVDGETELEYGSGTEMGMEMEMRVGMGLGIDYDEAPTDTTYVSSPLRSRNYRDAEESGTGNESIAQERCLEFEMETHARIQTKPNWKTRAGSTPPAPSSSASESEWWSMEHGTGTGTGPGAGTGSLRFSDTSLRFSVTPPHGHAASSHLSSNAADAARRSRSVAR